MGINAIIAAAGVLGTVFTVVGSAIATALGAITWPIVAVGAAIVAGALLIRKYWEPISAFFSGVIEGIMSAFAPVGEMLAPLTPIFDGLGEKLRGVWQWFKDLIAPVKATQETLDSCKNVGVIFGQALASALMAPLNVFNKLRSGADWLLEKLGIINKESDSLYDMPPKPMPPHRVIPTSRQPAHMAAIRLISQLPHRRGALTLTRAKANTTSICRKVLRRGISRYYATRSNRLSAINAPASVPT
ncbi:hypothetical protein ACLB1Q_30185 [Escherichia coli]